ncbi:MAG: hypothetical protein AB7V08_13475 [Elusimicrobiales bacterium]
MMKHLLFFLLSAGLAAPSGAVELETLGNILVNGTGVFKGSVSVSGIAAPSVSPAGQGVLYFDTSANKFKVSENAGSYWNLVPAGTANYLSKFSASQNLANSLIYDSGTNIGIGDASPASLLTVGNGDLFQVDSSGNLVKLRNVAYSWPSAQGAANSLLQNNGSGVLTWASVSASGDNLGNHVATTTLNMAGFNISSVSTLTVNAAALFDAEYDNGVSGTAKTITWTNGNKQKLTLTGNVTLTFSAPAGTAGHFLLHLVQDATGSRIITWPATVKWRGGVSARLSTAASAVDLVNFYFDGTNYYGSASTGYQ